MHDAIDDAPTAGSYPQKCRRRVLAVALIAAASVLCRSGYAAEAAPPFGAWEPVMKCLGLLPPPKRNEGQSMLQYLEKQSGQQLSEEERQVFLRDAGGAWKRFSDDLVSFDLPDEPLLKVVSFEPEENPELQIVGGAVGNTDKSFAKVYRITVGQSIPYGLVFVSDETWFDEGICLCGAIDLKTFVPADGNLLELSQLAGGGIKKFQVISDTHRAILFEWTHSAVTQSAYARIGASLRLKPASQRSVKDWVALTKTNREIGAGIGWLRPGMAKAELLDVMGPPAQEKGNTLIYTEGKRFDDGRGSGRKFRLPLSQGRLMRFKEGWLSYEDLPAPRGTNAWIEDSLRAWDPDRADRGKKPPKPIKSDIELILKRFHEEAKSAKGEDWTFWCNTIAELADLSIKDAKAASLVANRCMDMSLPQSGASWVLEEYKRPELKSFVRHRLRFILDASYEAKQFTRECDSLFRSFQDDEAERAAFVREGLVHPDERIRQAATGSLHALPKPEAREFLRKAFSEAKSEIRFAAILAVRDLCTKADSDWLSAALEKETDVANRGYLQSAMNDLK